MAGGLFPFCRVTRYDCVNVCSELGGVDVAQIYDSDQNDTFDGYSDRGVLALGSGIMIQAWYAFEDAVAHALDRDDNDTATLHEGTIWQRSGDWENQSVGPPFIHEPGVPDSCDCVTHRACTDCR